METKKEVRIFCTESDRKSFDQNRSAGDLQATYICKQCFWKIKVADKITHDKKHADLAKEEEIGIKLLSKLFASSFP